jgi:hypothetical protein
MFKQLLIELILWVKIISFSFEKFWQNKMEDNIQDDVDIDFDNEQPLPRTSI